MHERRWHHQRLELGVSLGLQMMVVVEVVAPSQAVEVVVVARVQ